MGDQVSCWLELYAALSRYFLNVSQCFADVFQQIRFDETSFQTKGAFASDMAAILAP